MSEHTPEQFSFGGSRNVGGRWQAQIHVGDTTSQGNCLAIVYLGGLGATSATQGAVEATANRIIASYNALAGMNPEGVKEVIAAAEEYMKANPAFRSMPVGASGSLARSHQEAVMESETRLRAALAALRPQEVSK